MGVKRIRIKKIKICVELEDDLKNMYEINRLEHRKGKKDRSRDEDIIVIKILKKTKVYGKLYGFLGVYTPISPIQIPSCSKKWIKCSKVCVTVLFTNCVLRLNNYSRTNQTSLFKE